MSRRSTPPKYARHSSGQARVRIDGRVIYLGPYGSPESRERYAKLVGDWLQQNAQDGRTCPLLSVGKLSLAYIDHARKHYRKNGRVTSEVAVIRSALRTLCKMFRDEPARDFGPAKLKAVRQKLIDAGLARTTINAQVGKLRRMFRWAVAEELVPASVLTGLEAVRDLQRGRSEAVETDPVKPVPQQFIDAVLPLVSPEVKALIEFQLATGARPGEARIVRACDLNTTGAVWEYTPSEHKTEHHNRERVIYIGPRGQQILAEFLTTDLDAYVFCPPGSAGCRPYERNSYRNAIGRACRRAGVPAWTPNGLRHNFATTARREFGIESTRTAMGHSSAVTSELYAERDADAARAVVAKIG